MKMVPDTINKSLRLQMVSGTMCSCNNIANITLTVRWKWIYNRVEYS